MTLQAGSLWPPARPLVAVLSGDAEGSSISVCPPLPLMRQEALQAMLRDHGKTRHPVRVAGEEGKSLGRVKKFVLFRGWGSQGTIV